MIFGDDFRERLAIEFKLTSRQAEIALLFAEGLHIKKISNQLNIELNTTRTHLRSIFQCMHVSTKHAMVAKIYQRFICFRDRQIAEIHLIAMGELE